MTAACVSVALTVAIVVAAVIVVVVWQCWRFVSPLMI
jgi:hypothetical protein